MKKNLFVFLVFAFFLVGCSKKVSAQQVTMEKDVSRLTKVLALLSEDARKAIPNGDAGEFLTDLHKVLDSDKDGLLVLCDKTHPIGESYVPSDIVKLVKNDDYTISRNDLSLRNIAEQNLRIMAQAAKKEGLTLLVSSSYRSYDYQVIVYNRLVKLQGQEITDRESARPGTSQHQLGTVVDFGSIDDSWIQTKPGKWVNEHAGEFGWSLSFPEGYEEFTGYRWECWHFRYIGKEACDFQKKWFSNIQQFMLEFIDAYKKTE